MNALVIFDGINQDDSLGIEIDRIMTEKGWLSSDKFSFAYIKPAHNGKIPTEAEIISDVDASTLEAEWEDVNYLYQIGTDSIKFGISPGSK